MSGLASWFSTKSGRKFTRWCIGAAALSVFGNQIAIHGPFLDKLKEIFQVYRYGKPRPLPPKVNEIVEEVLRDCSLKEEQKKKLRFFYVVGHDMFHAGGVDSPWGAIIGIPFTFEDIKDVALGEIRIQGKETIDWLIDGQDLIKAFTISDSAKKFALMREIYSCDFSQVLINSVIAAGCVLLPARFAHVMNAKSNALEKLTLRQRGSRYFILYTIGYMFYRLLKDPLKHIADKKADELAAETSIEYLNGGVEYYKKIVMKNKALGELTNSKFRKIYDEQGNENYFLFAPKLPVTKRLDNLRNIRKEKLGIVEDKSSE